MREILFVGLGGFCGAVLRYWVSGLVHRAGPFGGFPLGTLMVNLAGCLAIGWFTGLAASRGVLGPQMRLFLLIGLLGGFTTYSTFAYETVLLARDREVLPALANVGAHLLLGLGAVWLGDALAHNLWR